MDTWVQGCEKRHIRCGDMLPKELVDFIGGVD